MPVKINIPTPLRPYTGNQAVVEIEGSNIGELLQNLTQLSSQDAAFARSLANLEAVTGRLVAVSFHCEQLKKGGVFSEMDQILPLNPDYVFENFVTGPCNRLPHAASIGLVPGYFGAHMLGAPNNPFVPGGDPNAANFQVQNLNLASGLSIEKLEDRRALLDHFDKKKAHIENHPTARAMDKFAREAFDFVAGPAAREAFAIHKENPKLRDQYGRDNWGQSTLLARRLVEAGSTFVTVHFGGWDHHWDLQKGYENVLPKVDRAVATLFSDLDDRGLLDTTLVVLCGEFSRTPKMNDGGNGGPAGSKGTPGRDHWGNLAPLMLCGGGLKPGQVIGQSSRDGADRVFPRLVPAGIGDAVVRVLCRIRKAFAGWHAAGLPRHRI